MCNPADAETSDRQPAAGGEGARQQQPPQQPPRPRPAVAVVAPGAGVRSNKAVYDALQREGLEVKVEGRAGSVYDVYPETWREGRPAPNLQSFAEEVSRTAHVVSSDCLLVGSRGGQVVLPFLWKVHGASLPPAVVLNGGCAMSTLPTQEWKHWPENAVAFLLMGGEDFFRGNSTTEQHLLSAMSCVPRANATTAILYVDKMKHTPQGELLQGILRDMIQAAMLWKASGEVPEHKFKTILGALRVGGWTGRLVHKRAEGAEWEETAFCSGGQSSCRRTAPPRTPVPTLNLKGNPVAPQAPAAAAPSPIRAPATPLSSGRANIVTFPLGTAAGSPRTALPPAPAAPGWVMQRRTLGSSKQLGPAGGAAQIQPADGSVRVKPAGGSVQITPAGSSVTLKPAAPVTIKRAATTPIAVGPPTMPSSAEATMKRAATTPVAVGPPALPSSAEVTMKRAATTPIAVGPPALPSSAEATMKRAATTPIAVGPPALTSSAEATMQRAATTSIAVGPRALPSSAAAAGPPPPTVRRVYRHQPASL